MLALAHNGDTVTIDAENNTLKLEVAAEEIERRRAAWSTPAYKVRSGVLWKYIRTVSSASEGCVTDRLRSESSMDIKQKFPQEAVP